MGTGIGMGQKFDTR